MLDTQKLQELLDYTKKVENGEIKTDDLENQNIKNPFDGDKRSYKIFQYAIKLNNYDKLPQILANESFDKLSQSEPYYRGVNKSEYLADLLFNEDFHSGSGVHGEGVNTTTNYGRALYHYAKRNSMNILKFKMTDDANVVDRNSLFDLTDEIVKQIKTLSEKDLNSENLKDEYLKIYENVKELASFKGIDKELCLDIIRLVNKAKDNDFFMKQVIDKHSSTIAVMLGIDALSIGRDEIESWEEIVPTNEKYHIILNRGKMAVKKSDYELIKLIVPDCTDYAEQPPVQPSK